MAITIMYVSLFHQRVYTTQNINGIGQVLFLHMSFVVVFFLWAGPGVSWIRGYSNII